MIHGLDLFSGIGGITEGLSEWIRPIAYCERDRFARRQLLERQFYGHIPRAPIWDDVRSLNGQMLPQLPHIIYGGFPCQDVSIANTSAKGLDGERSGLFFEIARLCRDIRPQLVFLENVPAITIRGLDRICMEFTQMGYDLRWTIVSAAEVGAPHLRERWFMLAHGHGHGHGLREQSVGIPRQSSERQPTNDCEKLANTKSSRRDKRRPEQLQFRWQSFVTDRGSAMGDGDGERLQRARHTVKTWQALAEHRYSGRREWPSWLAEPTIRRGTYGVRAREHEIKSLGNAVVPLQVREAFGRLAGFW